MKAIDIDPNDLTTTREILRKHVPEYEVRAFGSRVHWTAHKASDLDLVIMNGKLLDISRLADLREAFTESDLPFKVDVVNWAGIMDDFRRIIEQEYVVIQEPDEKITTSVAGGDEATDSKA